MSKRRPVTSLDLAKNAVVLIAGGVGIPPVRYVPRRSSPANQTRAWFSTGVHNRREHILQELEALAAEGNLFACMSAIAGLRPTNKGTRLSAQRGAWGLNC